MEMPHMGKHCSEVTCNKLDFLPVNCDACNKTFCSTHYSYDRHSCPLGGRHDVQVPVCPLCGEPVPTAPGVEPDLTVGRHIDQQCKSDSRKIFTNRCTFDGCKRKELVPVTCTQCRKNFCLRHRHFADHNCTSNSKISDADQRALIAKAAEYRRTNKPTTLFNVNRKPNNPVASRTVQAQTHARNVQGNMTEDEALARAIALSVIELDESADRNRRNAAAASQRNSTIPVGGRDRQQQAKDKCLLS